MFEGARRIAKIIGAIWVVGCCLFAFMQSETIYTTYSIWGVNGQPLRLGECAYGNDAEESFYRTTQKGSSAYVTLCFKTSQFNNGKLLVPYFVDKANMVWGGDKYSSEVTEYTKSVARNFKLAKEDEDWVDNEVWSKRWKNIADATGVLFGGLAFMWAFSWGCGWVIRGFLGIPMGRDSKPEETQPPQT